MRNGDIIFIKKLLIFYGEIGESMELNKIIKSAISSALAFSMLGSIYNLDLISVNAAVSTIKGDANGDGVLRASDAAFIAKTLAEASIAGKKINLEDYPNADFNEDGKITAADAASIAKYLANKSLEKCEIKFRFADKSEGISLKMGNENYLDNMSQQDLNYRMQKNDTTLDEYKEYSKAQILEFTAEQKKLISDAIAEIQKQIDSNRYKLPLNEELIFINTTAEDELGSYGYTLQNQIYLSNTLVSKSNSSLLKKIITHEIVHCLTRSNPQFKKDMYKIIGFSVADEEPDFPQNIKENIISNPDVKYDSYATFTINGKKRNCYMVWYLTKPFEKEGDDLLSWSSTVLIPTDNLSETYSINDASDFWEVIGKNTEYVTAAEECLAENFAFAILFGKNGIKYNSPEIIANIIEYMK